MVKHMIRAVKFQNGVCFPTEDVIIMRRIENTVEIALPFHQDTPNLQMSVSEAYSLLRALDEVCDVRELPEQCNKK